MSPFSDIRWAGRGLGAGLLIVLLSCAVARPTMAHDFWIEPLEFSVEAGATVPFVLMTGHESARQRSQMPVARILQFSAIGPEGVADLRASLQPGEGAHDGLLRFESPGLRVLVLHSDNAAISRLPAERFNAHLAAEGLVHILESRARAGRADAAGSERYGRVAKSVIRIEGGLGPQPLEDRPLGLPLELVLQPSANALGDANGVRLRAYRLGRPLRHVQVRLSRLDELESSQRAVADEHGFVQFLGVGAGTWLAAAVWMDPAAVDDSVEFESWFASLTFERMDEARR